MLLGPLTGHTEWRHLFLQYAKNRRKYGITFKIQESDNNIMEKISTLMPRYGFEKENIRAFLGNVFGKEFVELNLKTAV